MALDERICAMLDSASGAASGATESFPATTRQKANSQFAARGSLDGLRIEPLLAVDDHALVDEIDDQYP